MCYFYSDSLAYNVSSNSTNTLHYTEDICADSAQVLNCNLVCKLAGLLRSPTYAFKFSLLWHIMYKYHSCYFMVMTSSNIYNIYHLSIFRIDLLTALLRPCSLYKVDLWYCGYIICCLSVVIINSLFGRWYRLALPSSLTIVIQYIFSTIVYFYTTFILLWFYLLYKTQHKNRIYSNVKWIKEFNRQMWWNFNILLFNMQLYIKESLKSFTYSYKVFADVDMKAIKFKFTVLII